MQLTFASYSSLAAVTPSDTVAINCRALYVNATVAGNIVVQSTTIPASTAVTIPIPIGAIVLPIELNQGLVKATGNTITGTIVALA
jgi:hypothetical protein